MLSVLRDIEAAQFVSFADAKTNGLLDREECQETGRKGETPGRRHAVGLHQHLVPAAVEETLLERECCERGQCLRTVRSSEQAS